MADDEIVTEQIRQLTLAERDGSTKEHPEEYQLMPPVDMRVLYADGEHRCRGADGPDDVGSGSCGGV